MSNFVYLVTEAATATQTVTETATYVGGGMGIFMIIGLFFMFRKAGHSGWKAIVPIYNLYTMNKIIYGNGWFFLITLIPIVNGFYIIYTLWKLADVFGRGILGKLLTVFFPGLMCLIMGFGESRYVGDYYNN